MSTTPKKNSARRVRYADTQKKEIVDFVVSYNAENGRGGKSAASKKFKVSPISITAWLKGANVAAKPSKAAKTAKAPKVGKKAKLPKAAKSASKGSVGTRYTAEQKQAVVDFVASYNAANGRGGQSKAALEFKVSPITVMAWLKAAGVNGSSKKAAKAVKAAKVSSSGSLDTKRATLLALIKEIATAEATLSQLNGKFRLLQASL